MISIQVLSRSSGDGKASAKVGTFSPYKVFGEAEINGNTSSIGLMEVLLRRAEKIAGRRARRALARFVG